jgi:mannosyltransferase OCH1-like enzyme
MIEPFDILIKKSYDFKQDAFDSNPKWAILRELFEKNFRDDSVRDYSVLPKKIHQIWMGGQLPDVFLKYTQTWKELNPDWEYKLWLDKDVKDIDIPDRDLFNSIRRPEQRSDFLRYHVLNQFGGIYADTDFRCLKSLNSLSYVDFLIGIGYPQNVELYIGLIGSIPNHPILQKIINDMTVIRHGGWQDVFETTGTYFFTRKFFEVVTGYQKGIVPLPTDYLYPFPNQAGHERRDGDEYIKPCSYAIHYWAVSWAKKW